MKICGIVAEFNPFHNGHAALIRYAKEKLGADGIVIVMSGEHVQRGEPAITDKYQRAEAALRSGADLILELPVYSAVANAEAFSKGAVSALLNSGIVDTLLFGSETGDIEILKAKAAEDPAFVKEFTERPSPNDALAVSYLRALTAFHSDMTAHTMKREGAGYNDMTPAKDNASAAYIRSRLKLSDDAAYEYMPGFSKELFTSYLSEQRFMDISAYSSPLGYSLIEKSAEELCGYAGVFPDLADKIKKKLPEYRDPASFIEALKSKDLTYSHISRTLLHILLGIRSDDCSLFADTYTYCPYLRILGINKEAAELLHVFGKNAAVPVISRLSDAKKLLDHKAYALLMHEIKAADIYHMFSARTLPFRSEYSRILLGV